MWRCVRSLFRLVASSYSLTAERAQVLRKIAATVPPAGSNVIVVTHRPNILDAFGKGTPSTARIVSTG
jgi:hypothetical protein